MWDLDSIDTELRELRSYLRDQRVPSETERAVRDRIDLLLERRFTAQDKWTMIDR